MAALNAAAPRITDRLCDACAAHFASLRAHLDALGIEHVVEPGLVRGLDYYTRTAFEFWPKAGGGQQSALGGGGRYDGLVELLGGRPTPGIGFGLGLDRVLLALEEPGREPRPGPCRSRSSSARTRPRPRSGSGSRPSCAARASRSRVDLAPRKLGRQLESAVKDGAHFAVIVGDELADGERLLRDLDGGLAEAGGPGGSRPALLRRRTGG